MIEESKIENMIINQHFGGVPYGLQIQWELLEDQDKKVVVSNHSKQVVWLVSDIAVTIKQEMNLNVLQVDFVRKKKVA